MTLFVCVHIFLQYEFIIFMIYLHLFMFFLIPLLNSIQLNSKEFCVLRIFTFISIYIKFEILITIKKNGTHNKNSISAIIIYLSFKVFTLTRRKINTILKQMSTYL